MKKIIILAIAFVCALANPSPMRAQDMPAELSGAGGAGGIIRVHLTYPHMARVNETVLIKSSIVPKDFALGKAISVKVTSKTNPESDYSYVGIYPNMRVTFYKTGKYALNISTGLLVGDG